MELPIHLSCMPRTQENVTLDNASASGAFTSDEYIRRKHARSVLCLPLTKQGELVALLYLENNLAQRVFAQQVAVLKFLASVAATSLDNARLYRALQEREVEDQPPGQLEYYRDLHPRFGERGG